MKKNDPSLTPHPVLKLTPAQEAAVNLPLEGSRCLYGPAGCGKTTAAVILLEQALRRGEAGETLVLLPQRTLGTPYQEMLRQPGLPAGGRVDILTIGGLAQRSIQVFWPSLARRVGFSRPEEPPVFLTLESAQYYLARFVDPRLAEGRFDAVSIDRSRLLSQILDNLNKSAVVGFPHTDISRRLKSAWSGKDGQLQVYDQSQECASHFRAYCLEHNLLDFSLQLQVFVDHLWRDGLFRAYLRKKYRALVYDNVEEDFPVAHDLVCEWLPDLDAALIIKDSGGGFRSFLGADPESAELLCGACASRTDFSAPLVESPALTVFREALNSAIHRQLPARSAAVIPPAVTISQEKYVPQMVEAACRETAGLYFSSSPPPAVCIVAPFLSDSLSFSLSNRLETLGVPHRTHRPSHPLLSDPAARCLLAFAKLAHPGWGMAVSAYEMRSALKRGVDGLDLVRADLLARSVLQPDGSSTLKPFQSLAASVQERITFQTGDRYEILRNWIAGVCESPLLEPEAFMSRLFGEVLSQPGFGFHRDFQAASIADALIESIRKFRAARVETGGTPLPPLGPDYIRTLEGGIASAQYLDPWKTPLPGVVFIAPAFTYLTANFAVDYQIWLDLGSRGWWERLYQPLTHPVVLSRAWQDGDLWTDGREVEMNRSLLLRLTEGLVRRCRKGIFMHALALNEQGDEQRGALLQAVQYLTRKYPEILKVGDV